MEMETIGSRTGGGSGGGGGGGDSIEEEGIVETFWRGNWGLKEKKRKRKRINLQR